MSESKKLNGPYKEGVIRSRVENCPQLGSLRSINTALNGLVNADGGYVHEIAEIIRKDPTLTTRLLRMVNSVFFGLSHKVTNIEDAIFYLGVRQVREMALATPIIEDFSEFSKGSVEVDWGAFWQHSIGCAMVTRELLTMSHLALMDETDYIVGLVQDVGKLVMAFAFPDEFAELMGVRFETPDALVRREKALIGWDHAQLGAYYLKNHRLSDHVVEAVRFHADMGSGGRYKRVSAALNVAEYMVYWVGVSGIDPVDYEYVEGGWRDLPAWEVLFPDDSAAVAFGMASLMRTLQRLPQALNGMVEIGGGGLEEEEAF